MNKFYQIKLVFGLIIYTHMGIFVIKSNTNVQWHNVKHWNKQYPFILCLPAAGGETLGTDGLVCDAAVA